MNRWQLYELLKGNSLNMQAINAIENMKYTELKEGVIEFLLMKLRTGE